MPGIAASRSRSFDPTGAVAGVIEHTGYGLSAGGTLGYNWQTSWNIMGGAVVVGLEGDIGYFNAGPERHGLEHRRRLRSRHVVDGHRPRPRRSRDRPEPHLLHRRLRRARPRRPVHRRGRDRLHQQAPERLCARQRPRDHARRRLDREIRIHVHELRRRRHAGQRRRLAADRDAPLSQPALRRELPVRCGQSRPAAADQLERLLLSADCTASGFRARGAPAMSSANSATTARA